MKKSQNVSEPAGEQMALFSLAGSRSHVKDSASPEIDLEQKMTVTSGRSISDSLTKLTPIGLLAKMLLESSVWKINPAFTGMYSLKWTIVKLPAFQKLTTMRQYTHDKLNCSSEVSVKVLKKEDMKSKRLLFRLQVSERRTKGKEYGLLPTAAVMEDRRIPNEDQERTKKIKSNLNAHTIQAMLPTPSAMVIADVDMEKLDQRREKAKEKGKNSNGFGPSLNELAVKGMLPTPTTKNASGGAIVLNENGKRMDKSGQEWSGQLHDMAKSGLLPMKVTSMMNTPTAQDADNSTLPKSQLNRDSVVGDILKTGITGQLNPQFVGEMMGFPKDWTVLPFLNGETKVLKDSEML